MDTREILKGFLDMCIGGGQITTGIFSTIYAMAKVNGIDPVTLSDDVHWQRYCQLQKR